MNQWTVVRIFVSSTFKDMDVERDALRNIVVPRLNDFFIKHHVNVQLVDLRHSVETDSKLSPVEREQRVFGFCMDEIDACQPFFLGLVGHRYGWIPKDMEAMEGLQIPNDFPFGRNELSVTACEFMHALFGEKSSSRRLVMLRDERSYSDLSEAERKNYVDDGENGSYINRFRDFLLRHKEELKVEEPYCLNLKEIGGKEMEEWSNRLYERLQSLILQHIGNPDSLAEESFFNVQRDFINRHLVNFTGREKVIEECMQYLERRQSLYIFEREHGMGQTALLCKLYALMSEDDRYLCLFNSSELSVEASSYENVLYYWDLQMLRFLGRDTEYLKAMRADVNSLFEEYSRLCQAIYNERHVKVVVFEENPFQMGNYFSLRQANNMYVQTVIPENSTVDRIAPYILGKLTDDDFYAITKGIRKGILQDLRAKKQSLNAKWLNMAVRILNSLNQLDYQDIRKGDGRGDNEININMYLYRIINEMPDDYEDLSYFWMKRLENVLGKDFVKTYIEIIGVGRGLTEEDISEITGRNVDWCTYFKHLLGRDIVKEDNNGYLTLREEIVKKVIESWTLDHRKELNKKLFKYIQQLPASSPTYQYNVFTTAMGSEDYRTCLEYISQKENYYYYYGESEAMKAFDQKATFHEEEYLKMVKEMVAIAPLQYDAFHGLNLWCNLAVRHHNYTLYLETAQMMIDRLEAARAEGVLDSSAEMALTEIYFHCGGAYVELPDGEGRWKDANEKQLDICLKHFNESLDWNARLMRAIYDRYEGFTDLQERWRYLQNMFVPLERKQVLHDDNAQFDYYFRLLREVAILTPRFERENDPGEYAMKAYNIARAIKVRQEQQPDKEVDSNDVILEWLLCAWQIFRLSPHIKSMNRESMHSFVGNVLEEMSASAGKFFCFRSYSVVYAQLTAEYAMDVCHSDSKLATRLTDRLLDLIVINDIPDDALKLGVSQKSISFMTRVVCFMDRGTNVDYSDISFAWALVARSYIRKVAKDGFDSAYLNMGDEIETVMKLSKGHPATIWDRQLDPNFVLLTAMYVKLVDEDTKENPDLSQIFQLTNSYLKLFQEAVVHYRYINFTQYERVQQMQKKLRESLKNRTQFSQEELECLIDEESYDEIIRSLCMIEQGNKEEFFYLGLAYLRNNQYDDAIRLYQMLLGIKNLPGGFYFSCLTNFLFTLLAAGNRKAFKEIYQQLSSQDRQDSDIEQLYQAYMDSMNRIDGKITLPKPYGYKL